MAENTTLGIYTHVIFDMDGLLLDTERIYTECYNQVAAKYGTQYTWDMKVRLMGRPGMPGAELAVEMMKLPLTAQQFMAELQSYKDELFSTAQLLPGVDRLVRHLISHGIPVAVASGSATKDFKVKTTNHRKFFELFPVIVLGDDSELKHGKPAPDQFILTASRFPDSPATHASVLVFEDSPNGVLAAKAAGMGVVLVPDSRLDKSLYHDPTQVITSLNEFQPELFGLPPYDTL